MCSQRKRQSIWDGRNQPKERITNVACHTRAQVIRLPPATLGYPAKLRRSRNLLTVEASSGRYSLRNERSSNRCARLGGKLGQANERASQCVLSRKSEILGHTHHDTHTRWRSLYSDPYMLTLHTTTRRGPPSSRCAMSTTSRPPPPPIDLLNSRHGFSSFLRAAASHTPPCHRAPRDGGCGHTGPRLPVAQDACAIKRYHEIAAWCTSLLWSYWRPW